MTSRPPLDSRLTEQRNPASAAIDRLSALEIARLINREDHRVAPAIAERIDEVARAIEYAEGAFRTGGRLIYVGAGTSGRLGVLDASEMPPTYGTDPEMVQGVIAGGPEAVLRAMEGAEDRREDGAAEVDAREVDGRDFVFGIATSGTTPFVHGALTRAKQRGARTGFLLCTPPDEWMTMVYDVVIALLVGPEVVTGSTRMKAGTATKLVLNTITTGAMIRLGKVYGNLMVDLRATNEKLRDRSERILMETLDVDRAAARDLLERAGGTVKTAMVMHWTDGGRADAEAMLSRAGGRLGEVLRDRGTGDAASEAAAAVRLAAYPERPPSEVEWEELLQRVELAPRALRFAVDDAAPGAPGVMEALRHAFAWEVRLRAALEAMTGQPPAALPAEMADGPRDAEEAVLWIARLRARNFAMVQRRGLEVWGWRAADGPLGGLTAYQLLSGTVARDRETLDGVRAARRG
jgi:N-acetylmuramic acid 6-phosphate etherase